MNTKTNAALKNWEKTTGDKPTKYEQSKFREGFRAGIKSLSTPCPYGVGDGNISRAEWAWTAGFQAVNSKD